MKTEKKPPIGDSDRSWVIPLFVAALALSFTVVRLLAFSRGEMNTALGIVAETDFSTATVSLLVSVVPWLALPASAALALVAAILAKGQHVLISIFTQAFAGLTFVIGVLLSHWAVLAITLFFLGLLGMARLIAWATRGTKMHKLNLERFLNPTPDTVIGIIALLCLGVLATGVPWMPSETLTIDGAQRTGYVVSADDTELVVVLSDDRELVRVALDRVSERQPCILQSQVEAQSIVEVLFSAGDRYPMCPQ